MSNPNLYPSKKRIAEAVSMAFEVARLNNPEWKLSSKIGDVHKIEAFILDLLEDRV